jgi:hypothetical protein
MRKRMLGRLLFTSLVITGLAGTVKDNTLTNKERKYANDLLKSTKDAAIETTAYLSENQLDYKTAPERWSVKECMYHIAGAEKLLWGMLETAMKSPANPDKKSEDKVTDEQLVKMVEDRTVKAKAPEPIQPQNTGYKSLDEATEDFKLNRQEHIKYVNTTMEDLRSHFVQTPAGWIDCYQLILLIGAHSNRHTQQMQEVKDSQNFPAE